MAINDVSLYPACRAALPLSAPATTEQVSALKTELDTDPTARGYKDSGALKPVAELVTLLNDQYIISNPTPQGTVSRGIVSKDQFDDDATLLVLAVGAWLQDTSNSTNAAYPLIAGLKLLLDEGTTVDYDNPVFQQGMATLEATVKNIDGSAITAAQVAAFTTKPDPSWQPNIAHPSPASAICGIAEAQDIAAAIALGA